MEDHRRAWLGLLGIVAALIAAAAWSLAGRSAPAATSALPPAGAPPPLATAVASATAAADDPAPPARSEAEPGALLLVRAVDWRGNAVAGAAVELRAGIPMWVAQRSVPVWTGRTDGDGRALVPAPDGDSWLRVSREPFGSSGEHHVNEDRPRAPRQWTVELRPTCTIAGTVLDAAGPAADADVVVQPAGLAAGDPRAPLGDRRATTDTGHFTFAVPGARYRVWAERGAERSEAVEVEVAPARRPTAKVTLGLEGRFAVRGLVLDARGQPQAGVVHVRVPGLEAAAPGSGAPARSQRTIELRTGEEGRFVVPLPEPGRCDLQACAEGHASSPMATCAVTAVQPVTAIELRLRAPAVLRGTVRRIDGSGVAGAHLQFHCTHAVQDLSSGRWSPARSSASTDARGEFASPPLDPDASYALECVPDPGRPLIRIEREFARVPASPVDVLVASDEDVCEVGLRLGQGGTWVRERVRIVCHRHALPDADARAPLVGRGWEDHEVDLTGHAATPVHLPRGATFYVVSGNLAPDAFGPFHAAPERLALDLQSGPRGAVRVTVRDAFGGPVADAQVLHRHWAANTAFGRPTDERGELWLHGLGQGRYTLSAQAGRLSGFATVDLDPGATVHAEVLLRPQ